MSGWIVPLIYFLNKRKGGSVPEIKDGVFITVLIIGFLFFILTFIVIEIIWVIRLVSSIG